MPQTWFVDTPPHGHSLAARSVAMLLDAPHDAAPAARMLDFLNQVAPVEYISLVAYAGIDRGDAPTLVEGHAHSAHTRNVTAECFAIYRRQYWRSDAATRIAQHLRYEAGGSAPVTALHFQPGDIPLASWRNEIYEREHLSDRLSFLYAPLPHTAYAINLYRDETLGGFQPAEIERLLAVAPLLRQAHRGALRLGAGTPVWEYFEPDVRIQRSLVAIKKRAPRLSPREAEVCARIACGLSADGIAAELDVAPSTVLTLRKRAYAKLAEAGLHGGRLALARLAG
ncbi:helix-turn-helix transcriptional regulator [Variovorax terrae]|uniref:helix-turn-helix transcriptional regulator n=1 Tax=Variovorax terrae TaxID=2923278 RepID=UPI0024353012|nr:helix-turn-helix transcriptional regulator [Variovorax terrae]